MIQHKQDDNFNERSHIVIQYIRHNHYFNLSQLSLDIFHYSTVYLQLSPLIDIVLLYACACNNAFIVTVDLIFLPLFSFLLFT
jgi:hypothetical protein